MEKNEIHMQKLKSVDNQLENEKPSQKSLKNDPAPKSPSEENPVVKSRILNHKTKPLKNKISPDVSRTKQNKTPPSGKNTPNLSPPIIQKNMEPPAPSIIYQPQSPTFLENNETYPQVNSSQNIELSSHIDIKSPRKMSSKYPRAPCVKKLESLMENSVQNIMEQINQESNEQITKIQETTETFLESRISPNPLQIRHESILKMNDFSRSYAQSKSPVQQLQINIQNLQNLIDNTKEIQSNNVSTISDTLPSSLSDSQTNFNIGLDRQNEKYILQDKSEKNSLHNSHKEFVENSHIRAHPIEINIFEKDLVGAESREDEIGFRKRVSFYKTKSKERIDLLKKKMPEVEKNPKGNQIVFTKALEQRNSKDAVYKTFTKAKFSKKESLQKQTLSKESQFKQSSKRNEPLVQTFQKSITSKEHSRKEYFSRENTNVFKSENKRKENVQNVVATNHQPNILRSKNVNNPISVHAKKFDEADPRTRMSNSTLIPRNNNNPDSEDPAETPAEENTQLEEEGLEEAQLEEEGLEEAQLEEEGLEEAQLEEEPLEEAQLEEEPLEEAQLEEEPLEESQLEEEHVEEAKRHASQLDEAQEEEAQLQEALPPEEAIPLEESLAPEVSLFKKSTTTENALLSKRVTIADESQTASKSMKHNSIIVTPSNMTVSRNEYNALKSQDGSANETCFSNVEGISIIEVDKKRQFIKLQNNSAIDMQLDTNVLLQRYKDSIYTAFYFPSVLLERDKIITIWSNDAENKIDCPPYDIVHTNQSLWACCNASTKTIFTRLDGNIFQYLTSKSQMSKVSQDMSKCDEVIDKVKKNKGNGAHKKSINSSTKIIKSLDLSVLCSESDDDILKPCLLCTCLTKKPVIELELTCESVEQIKKQKESFDCDDFCAKNRKKVISNLDSDDNCDCSKYLRKKKTVKKLRGACGCSDDSFGEEEVKDNYDISKPSSKTKKYDNSSNKYSTSKQNYNTFSDDDDEEDCSNFCANTKKKDFSNRSKVSKTKLKSKPSKFSEDDLDCKMDCSKFSYSNNHDDSSSLSKPSKSIEECLQLLEETKKMLNDNDIIPCKKVSKKNPKIKKQREDECSKMCRKKDSANNTNYDSMIEGSEDDCINITKKGKSDNRRTSESDDCFSDTQKNKYNNQKRSSFNKNSDSENDCSCKGNNKKKHSDNERTGYKSREKYNDIDDFLKCSDNSEDQEFENEKYECSGECMRKSSRNKGKHNRKGSEEECDCKAFIKNKNKLDKDFCANYCDKGKDDKKRGSAKVNRCASIDFDFSEESCSILEDTKEVKKIEKESECDECSEKKKPKPKKDCTFSCNKDKKSSKSKDYCTNKSNNRSLGSFTNATKKSSSDMILKLDTHGLIDEDMDEKYCKVKKSILKKPKSYNNSVELMEDDSDQKYEDFDDDEDSELEIISMKHRISSDFFDKKCNKGGRDTYRLMDQLKYLREMREINGDNEVGEFKCEFESENNLTEKYNKPQDEEKEDTSSKSDNNSNNCQIEKTNIWNTVYKALIGGKPEA